VVPLNHQNKQLQIKWYERLKSEGFEDIENTALESRPLLELHSVRFATQYGRQKQIKNSKYYERVSHLSCHASFDDICSTVTNHFNSVTKDEAQIIWDMHVDGKSERFIAFKVNRSKTCVHQVIERLLEWLEFYDCERDN